MTNVDPYARRPTPANMFTTIGRTYRRLAAYDKAQRLLEQALGMRRKLLGPEHAAVAVTPAEPLLREGLRTRSQAPDVVPVRRRTALEMTGASRAQRMLATLVGA